MKTSVFTLLCVYVYIYPFGVCVCTVCELECGRRMKGFCVCLCVRNITNRAGGV